MDKATEIAFILNDDTYFADTFSKRDRQVMAENIRNDFPLMLNTSREKSSDEMELFDIS